MASPFGRKLFKLFLIFSLVPAVLLTLTGYYLINEIDRITTTESPESLSDLAGYYNNRLYDNISENIQHYRETEEIEPYLTDFCIVIDTDKIDFIQTHPLLSDTTKKNIMETSQLRSRGFIQVDKTVYQYVRLDISENRSVLAGLVHTPEYGLLLEKIQRQQALRRSSRELMIRYIYFVGLVFVILAILSAIIAYVFSYRISGNLSQPIAQLSEASQKIAEGDFKQTVSSEAIGEIKNLVDNFNLMASRLETTTARLTQAERVAAWRNIARRFAHELKNPLQPILVSIYRIDTLLKDTDQYTQIKEPLQAASEELKQLTNLAERFSELAKLPPPTLKNTSLNELLNSFVELYKEELKAFDFSLELPEKACLANIDETYFREALHNLLKNAIEASPPGGRIVMALSSHEKSIRIKIEDSGSGMKPDIIKSARLPYFTTKEKGSGIGLAIVEKTIGEMGGQLLIDSEEGKGTVATIIIPYPGGNAHA